jgi:tripeptide aminopeptidase
MIPGYNHTAAERFLRYVTYDTQSDPAALGFPSTLKQTKLSQVLAEELRACGLEDAEADEWGYVYATIPSNSAKNVPVICFCSHIDTAPDCSGKDVRPIIHSNYNGEDIVLPDDKNQVISPSQYPYLLQHLGNDIITASGLTLLGADDKSGVAVIVDLANYLVQHPEVKHGTIRILFTPDEEVGRGTEKVNIQKLAADVGYTLDSGEAGSFEDETFSADGLRISVQGVIAHPGDAKGKMINAIKLVSEIVSLLPATRLSPESTEGRHGFVHPVHISGKAEHAVVEFIVRDFDTPLLSSHVKEVKEIAGNVLKKYPGSVYNVERWEQYRNMKVILDQHPQVTAHAKEAYTRSGLPVINRPIRGGTDGSRLSFMGLPCANIFTGMQAIHSRHEWIGIKDMNKSVEVLYHLVQVYEEHAS